MEMDSTKWIGLSKTFWGVVMMAMGGIAPVAGWDWFGMVAPEATNIFNTSLEVAGAIVALYGRIKASTGVTVMPKSTS
jgi:hypothetical protein